MYVFSWNNIRQVSTGKNSAWLECIKRIIENCGFSGIWAAQRVENTRWFVQSIKQKVKDLYVTEWFFTVTNSSSCMNYRLYKENIALERYLLKVSYESKRNLCLFRTRNHSLAVETGQWSNTDINELICTLCKDSLGDEYHTLMCCKKLSSVRQKYIKPYYYKRPNVLKYRQLMNVTNIKQLKNLCKFIKIIFATIKNRNKQ